MGIIHKEKTMREYVILTDSMSDTPKYIREKYDIGYVKARVSFDGKDIPASTDWEHISAKEFYDTMRRGTRIVTSQVPSEEFLRVYKECAAAGKDVLYIACSSGLSGSINAATAMAKEFVEQHPEMKIVCVDALISCKGQMMVTLKAAELRAQGKSIDEVAAYIEANRYKFHQFGTVENLEYLRRAGRVTATAAFFGNIFGVKPIILSDELGRNNAVKKVKGRKSSLIEIVNMMKQIPIDPENKTIWVGHADCIEDAEFIKDLLIKEMPGVSVEIDVIGPQIGASCGPGMMGIYMLSTESRIK